MKRQMGFSLVEIMLGMTLGLFLTTGIIQLYIGSNKNYRFQEEFARIQENGRFALELLNNSIRMTNFIGCSTNGRDNPTTPGSNPTPPTVTNVLNNNMEWWANVTQNWNGMLRGYDGNEDFPDDQVVFGTSTRADRILGTDAIISLGGTGSYSVTAADLPTITLSQINKPHGGSIQPGNILWICNATNVVLFQVTNVAGTAPSVITHADTGTIPGNNSSVFPIVFSANTNVVYETEVTDYVPTAFYIGVSSSGSSRSLFQMQLVTNARIASMQAEEMVEGVENMQIFYGEDINSDRIADAYMDASGVANWASVVSVRIELLLASEDDVLSDPQTYFFPNSNSTVTGIMVTATDKRWYQTFSTTIGIRNRLN